MTLCQSRLYAQPSPDLRKTYVRDNYHNQCLTMVLDVVDSEKNDGYMAVIDRTCPDNFSQRRPLQ
jgi:hypothetical protein